MKQLTIDYAKEAKEAGMQRAVKHADQVHDSWSTKAFDLFKSYLVLTSSPFKVEDFREWAKNLLPSPPSLRAFGAITVKAKKAGLIRHVGYAQVENIKAHKANCSLWQRARS